MSTKATVAHGPNFHLYKEVLDEDFIHLELEGVQYEATYQRVMVPIPVHVWEVIRRYPGADLSFAEKTDGELRDFVEQQVDQRIKRYAEAEEPARPLAGLSGALVFGPPDASRERQIELGMTYFTTLREHQRQIKEAIARLEQTNPPATQEG